MEVLAPMVRLAPDQVHELVALVASAEAARGRPVMSDQSKLALRQAASPSDASSIAVPVRHDGALVAFAQLSRSSGGWTLDLVSDLVSNPASDGVSSEHPRLPDTVVEELIRTAIDAIPDRGRESARVTWWRDGDASGATEAALGFELDRELLQMRRPLPTEHAVTIVTRSFVPGADEHAFLEVNNRAFADHHEQSGWTLDTVVARENESWFDPDGFRLHERDGRLAGFCWTKIHAVEGVHAAEGPTGPIGEIYVIAVDPDFAGHGLGKQLTLAGLDHLARHGITTAMLYVDADNRSAVAMYEGLGFHVHSSTKAFYRSLSSNPPSSSAPTTGKDHQHQ